MEAGAVHCARAATFLPFVVVAVVSSSSSPSSFLLSPSLGAVGAVHIQAERAMQPRRRPMWPGGFASVASSSDPPWGAWAAPSQLGACLELPPCICVRQPSPSSSPSPTPSLSPSPSPSRRRPPHGHPTGGSGIRDPDPDRARASDQAQNQVQALACDADVTVCNYHCKQEPRPCTPEGCACPSRPVVCRIMICLVSINSGQRAQPAAAAAHTTNVNSELH